MHEVLFEVEPTSKKSIKDEEKKRIQVAALASLGYYVDDLPRTRLRRLGNRIAKTPRPVRAFLGPVAMEVSVKVSRRNAPHIHTVVKNLQDLLGAPLKELKTGRRGIFYFDDRQIKYLSVRYEFAERGSIRVKIRRFSHFVEDLLLASEIVAGKERWGDNRVTFDPNVRLPQESPAALDEALTEALQGLKHFEPLREGWMEDPQPLEFWSYLQAQEAYFNRIRMSLGVAHELLTPNPLVEGLPEQLERQSIGIRFTAIPTEEGMTAEFKNEIRAGLQEFKANNPLLFPLLVPVSVHGIFKSPKALDSRPKDLDNVMRTLLPILHEELQPPPGFIAALGRNPNKDDALEEALSRIPKGVAYSVTHYEVMQLPRRQGDADEGFLRINLSGGYWNIASLWQRADGVIRTWWKQVD